jgi:hypothetical protein
MISLNELKRRVLFDPQTGMFTHLLIKRNKVGAISQKGYLKIMVNYKMYAAHRLAYFYMTGQWPEQIDHINGNRSDNRWCNLRSCSAEEQRFNLKKYKNNTSAATGVYWYKRQNRWTASIDANGKRENLGYFDNKEDAIAARRVAEQRHFGEFRRAA